MSQPPKRSRRPPARHAQMSPDEPPPPKASKTTARYGGERKTAAKKQQDRIWCVCGNHKDNGTLMIQCETSGVWLHAKCVGFKKQRDVPDDFSLNPAQLKMLKQYDMDKKAGKSRNDERQKPLYATALAPVKSREEQDIREENYLWVQCDTCSAWIVGNKWGFRKEADVPDYFMCDVCEEIEYGTDFEDGDKAATGIKAEDSSWHPTKLLSKPWPSEHSAVELEEYRRILEEESEHSDEDGSDVDQDDSD